MTARGPQPLQGQERRLRLLAFVKQDSIVRVDKRVEDTAMTWPHLLVIEFIAAMLFSLGLFVISAVANAPLLDHSNPDRTPNPSKAPWYFLNLQELLLHMHPALAGVLVPGAAIVALMAIPYVDRNREGIGTWFHGRKGRKIALFTVAYSLVVLVGLILLDALMKSSATASTFHLGIGCPDACLKVYIFPEGYGAWADRWLPGGKGFLPDIVIPVFAMLFFPALLVLLVKRLYGADRREWIIALFTGFITIYFAMTFIGTQLRGTGMDLYVVNKPPPHE